ncbi:MAG TPA: hypothetical protein PKC68_03655 [Alphaproteobacteria bacterium]|nr:hypothetical protein [Alphaproteobacteria bacterium]
MMYRTILAVILLLPLLSPASLAESEDPALYNQIIYKGYMAKEDWVKNPVHIAWQIWQPESLEGYPIFTVQRLPYPGLDPLVIRLVTRHDGFLDDSISGEQRLIDFKKIDGVWQIIAINRTFECQEDRSLLQHDIISLCQ